MQGSAIFYYQFFYDNLYLHVKMELYDNFSCEKFTCTKLTCQLFYKPTFQIDRVNGPANNFDKFR